MTSDATGLPKQQRLAAVQGARYGAEIYAPIPHLLFQLLSCTPLLLAWNMAWKKLVSTAEEHLCSPLLMISFVVHELVDFLQLLQLFPTR